MLSEVKLAILELAQRPGGVTTTQLIKWDYPTTSADRRARELREEGYMTERPLTREEADARGLTVLVSVFFVTERGRVQLLREANTHAERVRV